MFKNPSFLFDIICTAAWIILVVRYARKGFLSSIVQLVGNLFSLLGAKELSAACAGWVFEHMLAGGFRTQIAAKHCCGRCGRPFRHCGKVCGLPACFFPRFHRGSLRALHWRCTGR